MTLQLSGQKCLKQVKLLINRWTKTATNSGFCASAASGCSNRQ